MSSNANVGLKRTAKRDDDLYNRFAKKLEKEHKGKYIAISEKGEVLISKNDVELLQEAIKKFGPGKFAFRKVGHKTLGKWRTKHC